MNNIEREVTPGEEVVFEDAGLDLVTLRASQEKEEFTTHAVWKVIGYSSKTIKHVICYCLG